MKRFARIVLGYHGCEPDFAEDLLRGEIAVKDWKPSKNPYDWLGHGIYFWEHGPERARDWGKGGVVGAVIQLGLCLDLTDVRDTRLLAEMYEDLKRLEVRGALVLPKKSKRFRRLDCLVINELVRWSARRGINYQTVRCPFLEGDAVFPGSGILKESHIQIAVREGAVDDCILGVFRPNLLESGG
jgi:hypothetical protein